MDSRRPVLGIAGGVLLVFGGLALGLAPFQFALADGATPRPVTVGGTIAAVSLVLAGGGVLLQVADLIPRDGPDLSTLAGGAGILISLVTFFSGIEVTLGAELYGVVGGFLSVLWEPSVPEPEQATRPTRRQVVNALVVVVVFLSVTNPIWLFPHDGTDEYTYQRAQLGITNESITYILGDEILTEEIREGGAVENGTVTYREVVGIGLSDEVNGDLNEIACDNHDTHSRACAFDAYLVTHGPVHLGERDSFHTEHSFVYYNESYYRRIDRDHDANDSVTYDVKRIRPRELLAGLARNLSDDREVHLRSYWPTRLVVTGEPKTSFRAPDDPDDRSLSYHIRDQLGLDPFDPDEKDIGDVYRYNGNYYTVIVSEEEPEYPVSSGLRGGLVLFGLALWIYLAWETQ